MQRQTSAVTNGFRLEKKIKLLSPLNKLLLCNALSPTLYYSLIPSIVLGRETNSYAI